MKKWMSALFVLLAGCGAPSSISHLGWKNKAKENPVIETREVYFELNTETSVIFIRGYAPSVGKPGTVPEQSKNLSKYISENRACQEIWNFNGLSSVGERGFIMHGNESSFLVLECYLKLSSPDFGYIYEDLISHLARTDVIVAGGADGFSVNYFGKRMKLSDHNAEGHYKKKGEKDDEGESIIFWKPNLHKYYGVIGARNPDLKYALDSSYFIDTVSSPDFNLKIR